jgi:hypothetical protein
MDSLDSGDYHLFSVTFVSPSEPPVVKPIGPINDGIVSPVVVFSEGTPAPVWHIEKRDNGTYNIYQGSRHAKVNGLEVVVSGDLGIPLEWRILRGAPCPPPIGRDNFGIFVANSATQESWFIDGAPAGVDARVLIESTASSIFIKRVEK